MTTEISKVIRVGSRMERGRACDVFCKIEVSADGRLSISGVEGPTRGGDCLGSCGQIVMSEWAITDYAAGWSAALESEFRAVWNRWHLNDMRAGCEHQRGPEWDTGERIEIVTYQLTGEALAEKGRIKSASLALLASGETVTLAASEREILALPFQRSDAPDADSVASGRYEVRSREMKGRGWVRESEHPRGFLCKPCATCGYKYGSEWKREEVPADVLGFLASLPNTDKTPAWV